MNIEEFRDYCLSLPEVTESFPFDEKTLVFKIGGKMFALADVDEFESFNVKCDPELAIELRELHPCVLPGYHMSKKHWNTIVIDGSVDNIQLKQWIHSSYKLVYSGLTKKMKESLNVNFE